MYLEHFGLKEFPFSITPDTEFFFSSKASQAALNTLLIAVKTGEGFIKITGEVGTGKSMLCRQLMASLSGEFKIAYVPNPYLEPDALFRELAAELNIAFDSQIVPQHQLLKAINEKLLALHASGHRVVVCLDEAQAMPLETLEALRLLSNLETEKRKLLQVVIFGQPELEAKLNHPSIRQLKQRIAFDYCLTPMQVSEIDYYVQHRLAVAGHHGTQMLTKPAMWLLKRRTGCVPRLVNIVAHKALLSAFGRGQKNVNFWNVRAAANDTAAIAQAAPAWRLVLLLTLLLLSLGMLLIEKGYLR